MQEDVLERAKKAKEKAAREAMEARGLIPKFSTENTTSITLDSTTSTASGLNANTLTPPSPSASESDPNPAEQDPVLGVLDED